MKGLVVTNSEYVSLVEVKELIGKKGKIGKKVVIFDCEPKELCDLCYFGRSFSKVIELLCYFKFKNLEDIKNKIKINDFKAESFAVRCIRIGNHSFSSTDVEKICGDAVRGKVDLKNPQKILVAYIYENNFYFGIDYSGVDLGKRDYKIFSHPASLRGDIAYSLLRIADFEKKDILLDPFCGSGTILIEAALFAINKSVNYYNKNKFAFLKFMNYEFKDKIDEESRIFGTDSSQNAIIAAQKNAKIAGVDIKFSKTDVSWLDTRFSENYFDKIVTNPPAFSNKRKNEQTKKSIEELFSNAKYILKPKGTITLITQKPEIIEEIATRNCFKLKKKTAIGNHSVLVFKQ